MAAKDLAAPSVLVAGPSTAGKSLLISRLVDSSGSKEAPEYRATTGVDLQSRVYAPCIDFRELGGAMSSMWASYAGDARRVLLVLDASSPASVGEGVGMALQMAATEGVPRPLCLFANKQDAPDAVLGAHLQQLLGRAADDAVHVMQGSALAGDGLAQLLQWLAPQADAGEAL